LDAGDLTDQLGRGQDAAAWLGQQPWRKFGDEGGELVLERIDRPGELTDAAQLVACDPDPRGLVGAREASGGPFLPAKTDQDAARDLELGPQVVQVSAQVVDQRSALADEPLAMIDEQPHVKLGASQSCDGERVEAFSDRNTCDREGIDDVGLAALACLIACAGSQLRRDADDLLAPAQQKALQRP
jgi:hypothetical protein